MNFTLKNIKQNPLILISFWAGLLAGVFSFFFILVLQVLGVPMFDGLTNLSFVVNLSFSIIAILNFRNRNNNNELRFWQGLIICFMLFLFSSLVYFSLLSFYLEIIAPNYLSESISFKLEWLLAQKELFLKDISKEGFQNVYEIFKKTTAIDVAKSKIYINLLATFVYGIILSIIFRK